MKTVILVGLRLQNPGWAEPDAGNYRQRNWACNRSRWERMTPWPIVEGYHEEDEPFSLAKASNRAAALAGDWDVAVYTGADFTPGTVDQIEQAITTAHRSGQLTIAHEWTVMMHEEPSERVRAGGEPSPSDGDPWRNAFTGISVVPRPLWDEVGGFDERFVGWGWDDQAFWAACWAIGGGFRRVMKSYVYHLWHPRTRADNEEHPLYAANDTLGRRYLAAKRNRAEMLKILGER